MDQPKPLNKLAESLHRDARKAGFYDHEPSPPEKLMLIVTEVAEVVEELRRWEFDKAAHDIEVADVLMRLLDYAHWQSVDLDQAVREKRALNRKRGLKFGKRF